MRRRGRDERNENSQRSTRLLDKGPREHHPKCHSLERLRARTGQRTPRRSTATKDPATVQSGGSVLRTRHAVNRQSRGRGSFPLGLSLERTTSWSSAIVQIGATFLNRGSSGPVYRGGGEREGGAEVEGGRRGGVYGNGFWLGNGGVLVVHPVKTFSPTFTNEFSSISLSYRIERAIMLSTLARTSS